MRVPMTARITGEELDALIERVFHPTIVGSPSWSTCPMASSRTTTIGRRGESWPKTGHKRCRHDGSKVVGR